MERNGGNTLKPVRIAIIGDYEPAWSHHVTINESLRHAATHLSIPIEPEWIGTDVIGTQGTGNLDSFEGIWCASGSPYKSMEGALSAIRFARERLRAFFAT
ncbi:hypothetical protein L0156_28125 [bacterium]|nr:hypothetical protein [bacterium]